MLGPSGIITLLTDFGMADGYVAAMKAVILGVFPAARLVDVTHEVRPQDVLAARFLLSAHHRFFPPGTVHLAVVDPGVGTARDAIACRWDNQYFVAPDNGILDFVTEHEPRPAIRLTRSRFWRNEISATFHGRDIFAPVAAHIARGLALQELGEEIKLQVHRPQNRCKIVDDTLVGEIVYVDRFGNLITSISKSEIESFAQGNRIALLLGSNKILGLQHAYGSVEAGEIAAVSDSFDRVEIGVNCGNAQTRIQADYGMKVIVQRTSY